MNQKTIFTIIASLLVLQGIGIFIMSDQIVSDSFPDLSESGIWAAAEMATVVAVLYMAIGIITYYVREQPKILIAYTMSFLLIVLNTSKHIFISEMNVPLPLYLIQILLLLTFILLMVKSKKQQA
ncbi:hypothetical protein [Ekhidna sp.]|uniref:hypothetical protein n=1 Tax=Ekhidna sp. TaxID=2608089 RepID=UPI003299F0D0